MSKELTQLKKHRGTMQERPLTPEEEEQCRRSRHSSRSTGVPSTSWRTGLYARRSRPDKRLPATGKQLMHRSKDTGNRQSSS